MFARKFVKIIHTLTNIFVINSAGIIKLVTCTIWELGQLVNRFCIYSALHLNTSNIIRTLNFAEMFYIMADIYGIKSTRIF